MHAPPLRSLFANAPTRRRNVWVASADDVDSIGDPPGLCVGNTFRGARALSCVYVYISMYFVRVQSGAVRPDGPQVCSPLFVSRCAPGVRLSGLWLGLVCVRAPLLLVREKGRREEEQGVMVSQSASGAIVRALLPSLHGRVAWLSCFDPVALRQGHERRLFQLRHLPQSCSHECADSSSVEPCTYRGRQWVVRAGLDKFCRLLLLIWLQDRS